LASRVHPKGRPEGAQLVPGGFKMAKKGLKKGKKLRGTKTLFTIKLSD
jgi:hypothetical protein